MAKKILFFIILLGILIPSVSIAAEYLINDGANVVTYTGLVPCGSPVDFSGTCCIINCTFCHFFVMFDRIIDFVLFNFIPPVAVLMLVWGGIKFYLASENPVEAADAKKLMTSIVIGMVIAYSAWLIIGLVFAFMNLTSFGLSFTGPGQWFKVKCAIEAEVCTNEAECTILRETGATTCSTFHFNNDPVLSSECE